MTIIPKYEVASDKFEPEKIVDVVPAQAASNAKIQASEDRYLSQLQTNEERRFKNSQNLLKGLGEFSDEILRIAKNKQEQFRKDKKTEIAFDVMTKGIEPELQDVFRGDRELLFEDDIKAQEFANKVEAEGDSITAQQFRDMAGWEQYALVEAWARKEAKGYDAYYYQALETETVQVNRNGVLVTIGGQSGNIPENPAEQAALDEKIKFNYARRFAGISKGLVGTVVKPEIDKYDDKRRKQQAFTREKAYLLKNKLADEDYVENNLITANPSDGFNNADKFIKHFAAREEVSIGTARLAFADHLVKAVSTDKIKYPDALSLITHEITGRDGSTKSMLSWKEWSDLPERLEEAAGQGAQARKERRETMIKADLEFIKQQDDWTNDEKAMMRQFYKDKYSEYGDIVPYELQDALAGYEDDDEATRRLDRTLLRQEGKVYDFQLANVSPTIYKTYQDKLAGANALVQGTEEAKRAAEEIRGYTDIGTESTTSISDTQTPNWINLNRNLTAHFNREYQRALFDKDGVKINTEAGAYNIAMNEVKEAANDPVRATKWQESLFDSDSNEEKLRRISVSVGQAGGGKWKTNKIYASIDDQNDLINWAKDKSPTTRGIPDHYIGVAERLEGVAPYDLAQRQAAILSEGEAEIKDREVDEIENKPNRLRLIYHYPTKSRYIRSFIDYGYELNGDEPNVKTDVHNKSVLLTPGV